ncbi:hypothetical protein ABBQ32_013959 [Trebouxia sp. C0010 RCD-2024]
MCPLQAIQTVYRSVGRLQQYTASSRIVTHQSLQQLRQRSMQPRSSDIAATASSPRGQCTQANETDPNAREVLQFWLGDHYADAKANSFPADKMKLWFMGGPEVDREMTQRFGAVLQHAAADGLPDWNRSYNGLAAVLLMDQFARNVYRGTPRMFALDGAAMTKANSLITTGDAAALPMIHRAWLVYPFMHSEKLQDQQMCVSLVKQMIADCEELEGADQVKNYLHQSLSYAHAHLKVIQDWGRFPHRNQVLGRSHTPEEQSGLADGSIPKF